MVSLCKDIGFSEAELAILCISYNLFVDDWQMKNLYQDIFNGNSNLGIHVIMESNVPVAACVVNKEDGLINVFVKEEFRQKKYGQQVLSQTLQKYNKQLNEVYGALGVEGSEEFYNSCGVAYIENGCFEVSQEETEMLIYQQISIKDIQKKRINEYLEEKNLVPCIKKSREFLK